MTILLGIFVGGRSTRMGGRPKGLLPGPDGRPLLERLVDAGRDAGLDVVLVGDALPYADLVPDIPRIDDDPLGVGPLGGLGSLLSRASESRSVAALSVACDMPFVDAASLKKLVDHRSDAAVVALRRGEGAPWEPLFARWDPTRVEPALRDALAGGRRSFQALLRGLDVEELPLDPALERALVDWDTPEDLH